MLDNRTCFSDRGSNQSGGFESSCGSRSSARDRATPRMGDNYFQVIVESNENTSLAKREC
jgi:hypothetical protein